MGEHELRAFVAGRARRRHEDIDGSPFRLGMTVHVVAVDSSTSQAWISQSGIVEYYEYDCGCGQEFPHLPMIGVLFPDGSREEFWPDELQSVTITP